MDLERIKRKRQKSVQEQAVLRREELRLTAQYYREHPEQIPQALRRYASEQGIDWCRSTLMYIDINEDGGYWVSGTLLTQEKRFIAFDLSTNEDHSDLDGSGHHTWNDVSTEIPVSRHLRGTGISNGAWALEIQAEINGEGHKDA